MQTDTMWFVPARTRTPRLEVGQLYASNCSVPVSPIPGSPRGHPFHVQVGIGSDIPGPSGAASRKCLRQLRNMGRRPRIVICLHFSIPVIGLSPREVGSVEGPQQFKEGYEPGIDLWGR